MKHRVNVKSHPFLQSWLLIVEEYLRVAVGENQLVVDGHRFPLCQRLNQQLLFDLREAAKVSADMRKQTLKEITLEQ